MLYTHEHGDSSEVFPRILELWAPTGFAIDLTYGKGTFWAKVPVSYCLITSDINPLSEADHNYDCRDTGYCTASFDLVVFDPPYGNMSTSPRRDAVSARYNLPTVRGPAAHRELYRDGIKEAARIVKPGGVVIVKCQDQVDGGKKQWFTIDVFNYGVAAGLQAADRIDMLPPTKPTADPWGRPQRHSRAWGSTFWVFKKPRRAK